ncbi:MAG TPA: fused isobutyryl-CoA mutase/GTPase IcmF [Acidimicrobiales bacterium]|nr:fused isobutyryl-CoA mutase/GTPase IcmF [Acidimicrobiales bacterium]
MSLHVPTNPVRVVTAASLFDGHDAAINVMRRILQSQGAEVVHLGHDRSVDEVVEAAVEEDVAAVAISSYQGGHVEYFEYLVQRLAEEGCDHVRVYGGGGGVIVPAEVERLASAGVRIFTPADGQRLGLAGMINEIIRECDVRPELPGSVDDALAGSTRELARVLTATELDALDEASAARLAEAASRREVPVLGITGTGGSGKSSLTDELILRLRLDHEDKVRVAVLALDPTRRRAGGALLGDRIRMNAIGGPVTFFRSVATRSASSEVPPAVPAMVQALKAAGYDLVIVETPGIGQGDSAVVDLADVSLYVMTPEYGAASQLEKIDMLDFADVVAINKFERRGAEDALREVRRQVARNREAFGASPEDMPVFGTVAARFNDDGTTALYQHLHGLLGLPEGRLAPVATKVSTGMSSFIPPDRVRYLAEIAGTVRDYHAETAEQAQAVYRADALATAARLLEGAGRPAGDVAELLAEARGAVSPATTELLEHHAGHVAEERPTRESLSGTLVPRVALPRTPGPAELVRFLRAENLPGHFPFTAGVFPMKREDEDPTRMFAGEGGPAKTNARFHYLADGQPATRLSTAFDSVTLYGADPDERPDIYGKVGNSGVSIASLDDMELLYDRFDLIDPSTSVSMTINGPAPTILAMFLNTAIDQHPELDPADVLRQVRGTVQADILKEDQGQNTCILSTEFALRMMADIQEWFIEHEVRRFYSVSISGYHIAEAGANPISQLAFTLANGFTYVEAYLARGMAVDAFAPNLSFFFSNGMDPEYTVLGRVARRIWAVAMRDRYGADARSQRLKYHIQTSGRSLHAQEMAFNDIRTTLQALCAIYDNANSLHTNAYDEAVTTPTDESVRRAMAIQLIINREWGLAGTDNPLQGSFIVEELTDLVEEAVLAELERISERGGVLGAMETGYQRGRIQDESMLYEQRKHDGSLPIVGVNTFLPPEGSTAPPTVELRRSDDAEKKEQLRRVGGFQERHAADREAALEGVRRAALDGTNTFDALMHAVRHCTLGQITRTLYEVGGKYRRNV